MYNGEAQPQNGRLRHFVGWSELLECAYQYGTLAHFVLKGTVVNAD